jgi:hypothetical protein
MAGLGPKREAEGGKGKWVARGEGRRGARCWAGSWTAQEREALGLSWAKNRKGRKILFFFPFPIFQSHFLKDFESSFEFNSNHSIQKFKCSSMNAQSCFYPYI